jgi:uncharacterized protein YegL
MTGEASAITIPDIEFLLDASGSMLDVDCPGNKSRWDYSYEFMKGLSRQAAKLDPDGITVLAFSSKPKTVRENVTPDSVDNVYKEVNPGGGTGTHLALQQRIDAYFARKAAGSKRPVVIFVMTDGIPDDQEALARTLVAAANKVSGPQELAVMFLKAGKNKPAWDSLEQLDTQLGKLGAKTDIVSKVDLADTEDFNFDELMTKARNGG